MVDAAFDSGLVDRIVERLPTSRAVWDLIDEVAASPAVTAAISQQGLGFADQMGDEVRDALPEGRRLGGTPRSATASPPAEAASSRAGPDHGMTALQGSVAGMVSAGSAEES